MGEPRPQSTSHRILVVDDERLIVHALARMLTAAGYSTDVAGNGQEALEKVSRGHYDLIICDVKMPVMDGETFLDQLRRSRPSLSRRIVFCTGDLENPNTRHFLKTSGVPFILKPFRLGAVLEMVAGRLANDRYIGQPVPSV